MTPIYHITHIKNIRTIIAQGGLWCDNERSVRQLEIIGIAHQHIKDRRAKRIVPLAARGTLADYVPFYFGPRSPMLYTIHQGNVAGYAGGQRQVLHLVSSAERAMKLGVPWCFTEGHAEMAPTLFFDDWSQRTRVDWDLMKSTWWSDTADSPDRKRRRQAEFLVHRFFPWGAIESVGVLDDAICREVNGLFEGAKHRPAVQVQPGWYY